MYFVGEAGKKGGESILKGQFEKKKNHECLGKLDFHLTFVEDNDGKVCVGQNVTDIIKNLIFVIEVFGGSRRTPQQGLTSEREGKSEEGAWCCRKYTQGL